MNDELPVHAGISKGFDGSGKVYVPYMSDHGHALVGALRHKGFSAEMLPKPTERELNYGRRHSEGGECLPFVVTTGQFVRLIRENRDFDPENAALFMPTSSGPCRFGQYHAAQKMVLKDLGHDIDLISLGASDSYDIEGLGLGFRRLAWHGAVAVDCLQKLLWSSRPYELNDGETESLYKESLEDLSRSMGEEGIEGLVNSLDDTVRKFESLETKSTKNRPVIGIVGEIYVRHNDFCNRDVAKMIEELGGEVRIAPISEWFYYTNRKQVQDGWRDRDFMGIIEGKAKDIVQYLDERKVEKKFSGLLEEHDLEEPPVSELAGQSKPYIGKAYRGEPVLEIGKAIDFAKEGAAGILTVVPFSCMPGSMIIAVSNLVRKDHDDIPWLNLTFDAQKSTNVKTRLEAFMYQADKFRDKGDFPR